jgi:small subunit ribosomal protein S3Ae
MAVGKGKKGKKGSRKKVVDPFTKKEWYEIKAPNVFTEADQGWTPVTRSAAGKSALDSLRGRCVVVSQGDLNKDSADAWRKFKLRVEDISGDKCLTNFYGLDLAAHYLRQLVRKKRTLIESWTDVKTADGFVLRVFVIGFTKQADKNMRRQTCYAQSTQVRAIRKKMAEVVESECSSVELKDCVQKFSKGEIEEDIRKRCEGIYPLENVTIRKVKTIRAPKLDIVKLHELHSGVGKAKKAKAAAPVEDDGEAIERDD